MISRTSALSFRDQVRRHHIHLRTGSYSGHEPPDVVVATLIQTRYQNGISRKGLIADDKRTRKIALAMIATWYSSIEER